MTSRQLRSTQSADQINTSWKPGRMCSKCGVKHSPPTGAKCPAARGPQQTPSVSAALAGTAEQVSIPGPPQLRVPSSGLPVRVPVERPSSGRTTEQSMDLLANTVSSMATSMKAMQKELFELQTERANASWNHLQDMSMQSINSIPHINVVPLSNSSPTRQRPTVASRPAQSQEPVTLPELRSGANQRRAAAQQATMQKEAELESGEHLRSKIIKTGRDRVGGADHKLLYVRWPQEAVFIGPDRERVRYDELSQEQWTAGLTAIAAEEPNAAVQRNMLAYLAALLQDVCDYSFPAGRGAHALVLSYMEEGRLNWLDLSAIQKVRESYSYRAHAAGSHDSVAAHSAAGVRVSSNAAGKTDRGTARRRPCRNYNLGSCKRESSHLTNGFLYEHYCSFCATKGLKLKHSEHNCRTKNKSEGKANSISPE